MQFVWRRKGKYFWREGRCEQRGRKGRRDEEMRVDRASLLTQDLHCLPVCALLAQPLLLLLPHLTSSHPSHHPVSSFPAFRQNLTILLLQPRRNHNPWMLLFFISFLLIVSFFVLNMFVGVVVENFHKCRQQQEEEEARLREEKRQRRLEKKRRSEEGGGVTIATYTMHNLINAKT